MRYALRRFRHWIPNRAASTADTFVQRVAPMYLVGPASGTGSGPEKRWSEICDTVSGLQRATELTRSSTKYRAEFTVPLLTYKDDLRLIRQMNGRIDIISSSRIPGFDWGVNRFRVARVRRILRRKGLVR